MCILDFLGKEFSYGVQSRNLSGAVLCSRDALGPIWSVIDLMGFYGGFMVFF